MARLFLRAVLLVVVVCAEVAVTGPGVRAQGADPCPEPNNTFQAACYLGTGSDALGFLSGAEDVDAYRFEALDFGVQARLELAEMPAPYRLHLADWNGRVVAESTQQGGASVLEYTLGPPGSYYLFVDSATGETSASAPYRLTTNLTYARAVPTVLYANEFRSPEANLCGFTFERVQCYAGDGRFVISFANYTSSPQVSPYGTWGPDLNDFMLVADTRVTGDPDRNTYFIEFRSTEEHRYRVRVTMANRARGGGPEILLKKESRRGNRDLLHTDGYTVGELVSLDTSGGVNRTVIRAVGDALLVNVNGVEVADIHDDYEPEYPPFLNGRFGFGASALGEPPIMTFDNVLVTTP